MTEIELFAHRTAYAGIRLAPVLVLPALTPLAWAPMMVRMVVLGALALCLAMLTDSATPMASMRDPLAFGVALAVEAVIGLTFSLAVVLPMAALSMAGRTVDLQAGFGAAALLDPAGSREYESLTGTLLVLLGTVMFVTLDLHLLLAEMLVASVQVAPLGGRVLALDQGALLAMLGSQFLLGLMLVAPVVLGLLAIDIGVAFTTRSMPQANVYFLALPLKIGAAILLLAASLRQAPVLLERLFGNALASIPAVLGVEP